MSLGGIDVRIVLVQLLVFLFAITIHESAHAAAADRLGDPTARRLGRISLNPLRHIDLIGTVIFPIVLALSGAPAFGWAKPVPVDITKLRNPRRDHMLVAVAGPASNLLLALLSAAGYYLVVASATWYHRAGSAVPMTYLEPMGFLVGSSAIVNTYLALFNMIPLHPLDGGAVLAGLLPDRMIAGYARVQSFGFIALFVLFMSGALNFFLNPVAGVFLRALGVIGR